MDLAKIEAMAREFLAHFEDLWSAKNPSAGPIPAPRFVLGVASRSAWLARCLRTPETRGSTIEILRADFEDGALRRIIAHEIVHHVDNVLRKCPAWEANPRSAARQFALEHRLTNKGHGIHFQRLAQRLNDIYGEDFVTTTADPSFHLELTAPLLVLLKKIRPSPDSPIAWAATTRPSRRQIEFLRSKLGADNPEAPRFKLVHSTAHFLRQGPQIGKGTVYLSQHDTDYQAVLTHLWESAPAVPIP